MAPAALTRQDWEKAVVFMQKLATCVGPTGGLQLDSAAAIVATHKTPVTRIETASRVPMPPATWRKLLAKKVPLQMATACYKLLSGLPAALNTSAPISNTPITAEGAGSSTASAAQYGQDIYQLVLASLDFLVARACQDLCSVSQQDQLSADATAFRQQMQQSGLLQLLPQLLNSFTKHLQASTGLVPQLQPLRVLQGSDRHSSPSSESSSSSNAASIAQSNAAGLHVLLAFTMSSVLTLYTNLSLAWPLAVFVTEVAPDCTAAALELSWLSFQYISMVLPTASSTAEAPDALVLTALAGLFHAAGDAVSTAVLPITALLALPEELPALNLQSIARHRLCLLASPCTVPCMTFILAVVGYGVLLAQLPGLPRLSRASSKSPQVQAAQCTAPTGIQDGASTNAAAGSPAQQPGASSSTSTTSSSKAKPAAGGIYLLSPARLSSAPTAAWQLACKECTNIPGTHELLLQHLGLNSMSALFCAASWLAPQQLTAARRRLDIAHLTRMIEQFEGVRAAYCMLVGALAGADACLEYAQWPCSPAQRHLHLLLAHLLFYWAAHQPAQLGASGSPVDCSPVIETAGSALEMALQDLPAAQPLYFQQQNCASTIQDQQLCQLVLDEVLPLVVVVGSSALDSMSSNSQAGPAEPASSSSSSSSTTAAGSSNAKKTSQCATAWSSQPSKTALLSFHVVCMLVSFAADTSEVAAIKLQERAVLPGKLMEAAVRGWRQINLRHMMGGHMERGRGEGLLSRIIGRDSFMLKAACSQGSTAAGGGSAGAAAKADTPEQLQLLSLCCSAVKALTAMAEAQPDVQGSPAVLECCLCVAEAACGMLEWLAAVAVSQQQPAAAADNHKLQQCAAAAAAAPWLALSGRVMLFAANWKSNAQRESLSPNTLRTESAVVRYINVWLQAEGNAASLSAAGYDPSGSLVQQLQAAVSARGQTSSSEAAAAAAAAGTQQQQASAVRDITALQSIGQALSTLPCPYFCCHSACSNLAGPSELQLVNGKSCLCGGCLVARYCCRGCQRAAWKQHKPVCGAIAAASKQAADAGGGGVAES